RDAEAGAAILLRHRDPEPAAFGHGFGELVREGARAVAFAPIGVIKPVADGLHRIAHRDLLGRARQRLKFHRSILPCAAPVQRCNYTLWRNKILIHELLSWSSCAVNGHATW